MSGRAYAVTSVLAGMQAAFATITAADVAYVKDRVRFHAEEVLLPAMRAVHADASIETEVIGEVGGLEPMPDSEAVRVVTELTGGNTTIGVAFTTEAGLFQRAGIPAVVCGPGHIDQAHKPDEYVALDQLCQCLAMLERLMPRLAA